MGNDDAGSVPRQQPHERRNPSDALKGGIRRQFEHLERSGVRIGGGPRHLAEPLRGDALPPLFLQALQVVQSDAQLLGHDFEDPDVLGFEGVVLVLVLDRHDAGDRAPHPQGNRREAARPRIQAESGTGCLGHRVRGIEIGPAGPPDFLQQAAPERPAGAIANFVATAVDGKGELLPHFVDHADHDRADPECPAQHLRRLAHGIGGAE
jgi:hypothetical protein